MNKPRKRWKNEAEILKAIDRKRLLEKQHIKDGHECEIKATTLAQHSMLEASNVEKANTQRHYRRAALIAGQLKTLQAKLSEMRTVPMFPELMGDGSVQR